MWKIDSFQKSFASYADSAVDAFIIVRSGYDRVRPNQISRKLSLDKIQEIHERVLGVELGAFAHGSICIAYSGRCLLSSYFNRRYANQETFINSCRWKYNVNRAEGSPRQTIDSIEDGKPVLY